MNDTKFEILDWFVIFIYNNRGTWLIWFNKPVWDDQVLKTDTNAYFYFTNNQINPGGNIIQQISGSVAYLDDICWAKTEQRAWSQIKSIIQEQDSWHCS